MAFEAFISLIIDPQIINFLGSHNNKAIPSHKNIIIKSMQTYHDLLRNVKELKLYNKALYT